jgi:serine/threonine protein kinase
MTLAPGARQGSYEILSPLGRGGMGEVYRARDTRLGRDVAIKVLPEEFARDPERLARFQREARVVASLNHPNIAAIIDSESDRRQRRYGHCALLGTHSTHLGLLLIISISQHF